MLFRGRLYGFAMKALFRMFARNKVFSNIVLLLIFLSGAMALFSMRRENLPQFNLNKISIRVRYDGADPKEVEEGVTRKIEAAVTGIEGIKSCTTWSRENSMSALVDVADDVEVAALVERIRLAVSAVPDLPVNAGKPMVKALTTADPIVLLALKGRMNEHRLKEWAERIREDLLSLPAVSQVMTYGTREYEIAVEVSEQKLRRFGLSFATVGRAIRRSNLNLTGGILHTDGEEIRLRTTGRKSSGPQLADIIIEARPGGSFVTLDRIATIKDDFVENPVRAAIDGTPTVLMLISKARGEDALAISKSVADYVASQNARLSGETQLGIVYDNTALLKARIDILMENGLLGLFIVFAILGLFLNTRLAFWVGMGIPVSFSGALLIIWIMGESINMISLFGLITVLGIVVDDAIVVGEAIYVRRSAGDGPLAAAVNGVSEVALPVTASVLTSAMAFFPLYFVKGEMGKMHAILPVVVVACLLVSLSEGLFLLPAHLSRLPDPNRRDMAQSPPARLMGSISAAIHRKMDQFIEWIYIPLLTKTIKYRYIVLSLSISILLITTGLLKSGALKFEVIGVMEGLGVSAVVEFPEGTPPVVTRSALNRIEAALQSIAARSQNSGQHFLKHRLTLFGQTLEHEPRQGPHLGTVQAILNPSKGRGMSSSALLAEWEREVGVIPGVRALTFQGLSSGKSPPAPIDIWLQGEDLDRLLSAAGDLTDRLHQFEGVRQIRSDFSARKNEIRLRLKPEARGLGLTVDDLARQVHAAFSGEDIALIQRGREEVRVNIRYAAHDRSHINALYQMRIRRPDGLSLPLSSVATVAFAPGYAAITRSNGLPRVTVSADVDPVKANAKEIYDGLEKNYFPGLRLKYHGLEVVARGEKSSMSESMGSLKQIFPLVLVGIYVIIAAMFCSYAQPFLILLTVPFGIVGAVFGHLILWHNLSMMSIFGMVAVTGVVVNDAIVLIDRVNALLREGIPFFGALIIGGARRFRPIFLTTLSTVCGLAPLIFESDAHARFLIPMALSIAAGEIFATFMVVVQLPCAMAALNDLRLILHRRRFSGAISRSALEPATRNFSESPSRLPASEEKVVALR